MFLGKYFVITAVCLLSGIASALIARNKGHYAAKWFFYGTVFNVFAVIGALALQRHKLKKEEDHEDD